MTSASPEPFDGRVGLRTALSKAALRLQSDRRLVALTRDGSGLAFGVIMERYREPLLAYCRRLLGPDGIIGVTCGASRHRRVPRGTGSRRARPV